MIPINLVFEDILSEAILKVMLQQSQRPFSVQNSYNCRGFGKIKKQILAYNNAAQSTPYLVLTDLDRAECPLIIINTWFQTKSKHSNLLFRIAVREVEAWLMADREAFAKFLGISIDLIPTDIDNIADPKTNLINLVKKSKKRQLKDSIVPAKNSTAKIGKDYNGPLIEFVQQYWQVTKAEINSPSLRRAIKSIRSFQPS